MSAIFRFKQFSVDQGGCAMKINTDGVLLGAIATAIEPASILDIGTGTGVIALMLAQKYASAKVDGVEIDEVAAQTADKNFKASPFAEQLKLHSCSFGTHFAGSPEGKYDLIVSNPPFYIDSLKSPAEKRTLAKHTDTDFFEQLIKDVSNHLTSHGCCWVIVPLALSDLIMGLAADNGLHPDKLIHVKSYPNSLAHRIIICLSIDHVQQQMSEFIIYQEQGVYSQEYKNLLQPYFLAF